MIDIGQKPLTTKVALVTGGTSGIGKVTAEVLCENGASVVFVGRREEIGSEIEQSLQGKGYAAKFIQADLRAVSEAERVVEETIATFGPLDVAFNNAGVFDSGALFHEYDPSSWDALIAANLSSIFYCMRSEITAMLGHNGGVIINNASVVGHRGTERATPSYVASKHGVIGLTRQAALQYANAGIRVNSVSPGPTQTEIQQPLVDQGPEAVANHLSSLNPKAAFVTPEEIANVVLYLASGAPDMLTGQDIAVDGGQLFKL